MQAGCGCCCTKRHNHARENGAGVPRTVSADAPPPIPLAPQVTHPTPPPEPEKAHLLADFFLLPLPPTSSHVFGTQASLAPASRVSTRWNRPPASIPSRSSRKSTSFHCRKFGVCLPAEEEIKSFPSIAEIRREREAEEGGREL
jgi:hypothetical protein